MSKAAMALLAFLVLSLALVSKGFPSLPEGNNSNDTNILIPNISAQLFRDEDGILDDNSNEIIRGSLFARSSCRRKAKCEQLNYTTCLGVQLPYSSSTTDLVALSREEAMKNIKFWEATLSYLPKCWAVIQPLLCALYMPKCEDGDVDLPSQEMCNMSASSCRILAEEHKLTSLLECHNTSKFLPNCKRDVKDLRFNTSTQCMPPLVATGNSSAYFEGVEGCGVQCANPFFTPEEHLKIQTTGFWGDGLLVCMSSFAVLSFLIDWRYTNRFPSVAVFYMNVCFLISTIGFSAQFLPGARESIVCRKDGTLRMAEPSPGENYYCIIVFIWIYYPLLAAFIWFAIFAYAWNLQQGQVAGKTEDRIDKYVAYFHLGAWCLPVLPTIAALAMKCVDGNSELGICFLTMEPNIRACFLVIPVICVIIGGFYLLRVRASLRKLVKGGEEIISPGASSKIRRLKFCSELTIVVTVCLVSVDVALHVYEFLHRQTWKDSFRSFVMCKIMRGDIDETKTECRMTSKPDIVLIYVQLAQTLIAGLLINVWVWTPSNFRTWTRCVCKLLNKEEDEPAKLKKHHVIARTFAKRQALNRLGRLSISIHGTRDDPVGLAFELNSLGSRGMSSTWAAALPNLVTRRGALRISGSTSSQLRNSFDSDTSYGGRVSLDSRRQSLDSQLSIAMGDIGGRKPVTPINGVVGGRVKSRRKQRRRNGVFGRNLSARRSSSTSQDSQLSAQLLSTLAMALPSFQTCVPNMKRRTGNAGLDGDLPLNFKNRTLAPGLVVPLFPLFHRNMSGSEEESAKSGKEVPGKESLSQDHKGNKESTPTEGSTLKELLRHNISAAPVSSSSCDENQEAKTEDAGVDNSPNKVNASRRLQNKRYCKQDVSKKSGGEDVPMLDRESGKADDDGELDLSPEVKACVSRLKRAREIGTQTSLLSVNDIDAAVIAR